MKEAAPKTSKYSRKNSCVGVFFNEVAGLQDHCKPYLLHEQLRFYFSLGKTLKNLINFL